MERKQAAEALRMSEQRFQIFAESATDAIISIDHNGIIVYLNPEFENIFGYKNQEIIGNPITRLINPEDKKNSLITINKIIDGANIYKGKRIEIQGYHKSGKLIPLEISVGGFSTKEGKFYTAIVRDISERKKFDNQLIHTERMAGIGIMAAGMAHEINQPLNNISLSMDNLIISLKTGSKDQKYIDNKTTKIFDNVTRIRNIIDHLRDFSKDHDDYIQSTFSVNESILNAKSMIFEQFKHIGIQLSLKLDGTLPDPIGNTYKFEQVIVNLIINAKDAIEEKQNFLNLEFEKVVEIISSLEDSHICVEVKDTGIGIETKDLDKVMLPFYSTKKEGTGTGLGLSISFGIIRDMNGFIEIQSERLKGTTIRILIPKKKENPNQSEKV